jgi:predicted nucleic acid-binding protein
MLLNRFEQIDEKKLYIETSVWNQLEHDDRPEWRDTAEKFIITLSRHIYEPYISDIVIREIEATRDSALQKRLVDRINTIDPIILQTDEDVEALTDLYMKSEFATNDSIRVYNDCSHVAIATINEIRHIISFNCKHPVNDRRIDGFNVINFQNGYELAIDITTPHRFLLDVEQEDL